MFGFLKKGPTHPPARGLPPLSFHNTLSGKTEDFVPLSVREVKMYNCGPTPYDRQHIGNLVPPMLANLLNRTLQTWGYPVKQVMNVTDFGHLTGDNEGNPDIGEDKMSRGLKQEGLAFTMENMHVLAEKYTEIFLHDAAQLGVDNGIVIYPRASEYIGEMTALIRSLEQKGYAYRTSDGVYFDTARFPGYGKLGGINLSGLQEGARVAANQEKKNSFDFVLWKLDKKFGWESPWGKGFPGWHIECTAMIFTLLGRQIDIHTGGIEHIPIHHNNEIAQAEALTGKQYVRYWLHNAHITIEGRKISKSLGNTVYLSQIMDRGFSPRAFRYWYMTGHYRTPTNFTWEAIEGADTALNRLSRLFIELPKEADAKADRHFLDDFYAAIADDLDTPKALARVWELVKDDSISPAAKRASLIEVDNVLGLGFSSEKPRIKLEVIAEHDLPPKVQTLLKEREEARANKDFTRADELRGQIETAGFELKDTPEGPKITKK